ncbi:MAG: hypothetical protein M5U01_24025 [Ardenticatenaceae bacterium]|nr:hypothetical protein [Ardenticatenaceae bacterium]
MDLAQVALGPGMAVVTHSASVLDTQGTPMSMREALALINQILDEALIEQEGDFDADSRWTLAWFEQVSFNAGPFGVAETLNKARNTSVAGLEPAGLLKSSRRSSTTRLLEGDGESAAADLVARGDIARELAYRL